ncbi:MAG TPA: hypothetical protein DEB46_09400 [Myxococcales bacterium]|nr:hypothetical protein [Myxococcales bacterium]
MSASPVDSVATEAGGAGATATATSSWGGAGAGAGGGGGVAAAGAGAGFTAEAVGSATCPSVDPKSAEASVSIRAMTV